MSDTFPPWYHGRMSAEKATEICSRVGQNGAFLIRESEGVKGALTLSMLSDTHDLFLASGDFLIANKKIPGIVAPFQHVVSLLNCLKKKHEEMNRIQDITTFTIVLGEVYHHRLRVRNGKHVILGLENGIDDTWKYRTNRVRPRLHCQSFCDQSGNFEQSSNIEFDSLEELVDYYVSPRDEFMHPLTLAIYPSLVKQLYTTSEKTQQLEYVEIMVTPRNNYHEIPAAVLHALPSPRAATTTTPAAKPASPILTQTFKSPFISSNSEEDKRSAPPPVRPKPAKKLNRRNELQKSRSESNESCDSTNGLQSILDLKSTLSNVVEDDFYNPLRSRRTLSLDDIDDIRRRKNHDIREGQNKTSNFKTFGFSRITKPSSPPQNIVREKPEIVVLRDEKQSRSGDMKTDNDVDKKDTYNDEATKNETIAQDYTPILCKTQFITTTDYNTSENALSFTRGTEMAIKGVRVDGWWYCYNKSTQESGWVRMDYLKPLNDEKWFEATPMETREDNEVYDQLKVGDIDAEFDDENYCKYLVPAADANIQANSEKSEERD